MSIAFILQCCNAKLARCSHKLIIALFLCAFVLNFSFVCCFFYLRFFEGGCLSPLCAITHNHGSVTNKADTRPDESPILRNHFVATLDRGIHLFLNICYWLSGAINYDQQFLMTLADFYCFAARPAGSTAGGGKGVSVRGGLLWDNPTHWVVQPLFLPGSPGRLGLCSVAFRRTTLYSTGTSWANPATSELTERHKSRQHLKLRSPDEF